MREKSALFAPTRFLSTRHTKKIREGCRKKKTHATILTLSSQIFGTDMV